MTAVTKDCPDVGDVHAAGPMGGKKPKGFGARMRRYANRKTPTGGDPMITKSLVFKVDTVDEESHSVTGWASVIEKDGAAVVDHQGDMIDEVTLTKAAHDFMSNHRIGKAMHDGNTVSDAVESMVFTKDLQKALGIDLGMVGWLVKFRVNDADVWKRVKSGELRSFSIGGKAERQPLAD